MAVGSQVALFDATSQFLQSGIAADGGKIFIEQLIRRRQDRLSDAGRFGGLGFGLGVLGGNEGSAYGIGSATMAGIAGDFAVAFETVFIDGEHHLHHFAGGDFGLFVVLFEIEAFLAADVAVLAFDAERSGNELHGGNYLVSGNALQNFDVFVLIFGEFGSGGGLWRAGLGLRPGDGQTNA